MIKKLIKKAQTGSVVVDILVVVLLLSIMVSALMVYANASLSRSKGRVLLLQAQYAAESGADAAIAILNSDPNSTYTGTGATETIVLDNNKYKATYQTTVSNGSMASERIITSTGRVYQPKTLLVANYKRSIEVTAQRTSGTIAATAMMSRNIIEFASGVKDIFAKDLYVNGYIQMDKNVNRLHAENITVAGKNTGASNCSIGGSGSLIKPTSFTTPGQTKTNLTLAFNNCINPPGNVSNTDFNVLANQNTISKVQSTYVPWSQYMDSSYKNGNCTDWTSGASPRTIPNTGNSKKTQYPDSGSNISASCGTAGDLALGSTQFNITDNVHVRANFCAASACTPIFNNPSSAPVYIFVEGTVNFNGITTAAGSGPIILIAYGADPASKVGVCPLGGSVYLGNSGSSTVNAPQMYLLASNGICFDQTKFGANPSMGGFSGKNIYVATNSGTPFDPSLNSSFPTNDIPVDLSWHAARYRRL